MFKQKTDNTFETFCCWLLALNIYFSRQLFTAHVKSIHVMFSCQNYGDSIRCITEIFKMIFVVKCSLRTEHTYLPVFWSWNQLFFTVIFFFNCIFGKNLEKILWIGSAPTGSRSELTVERFLKGVLHGGNNGSSVFIAFVSC